MTMRRHKMARVATLVVALVCWAAAAGGSAVVGINWPRPTVAPPVVGLFYAMGATATLAWLVLVLFPTPLVAWRMGYRAGTEDAAARDLYVPEEWQPREQLD